MVMVLVLKSRITFYYILFYSILWYLTAILTQVIGRSDFLRLTAILTQVGPRDFLRLRLSSPGA
jgi:hypothetical protein